MGVEQSCCDDMESLGYILLYFLYGSLPWQDLKAATKEQKYNCIKEKKIATLSKELGCGFFKEFTVYLNYTCSL